jgi:hypothetical protein
MSESLRDITHDPVNYKKQDQIAAWKGMQNSQKDSNKTGQGNARNHSGKVELANKPTPTIAGTSKTTNLKAGPLL